MTTRPLTSKMQTVLRLIEARQAIMDSDGSGWWPTRRNSYHQLNNYGPTIAALRKRGLIRERAKFGWYSVAMIERDHAEADTMNNPTPAAPVTECTFVQVNCRKHGLSSTTSQLGTTPKMDCWPCHTEQTAPLTAADYKVVAMPIDHYTGSRLTHRTHRADVTLRATGETVAHCDHHMGHRTPDALNTCAKAL